MSPFEKAESKVSKAVAKQESPDYKKWGEAKTMLRDYQDKVRNKIKIKEYKGWENDRTAYLGGVQNIMNDAIADNKITNDEWVKIKTFLNQKSKELYEKMRQKQKEHLEREYTKKGVEVQEHIDKGDFKKAEKVIDNFLNNNEIQRLIPQWGFSMKEEIIELKMLRAQYEKIFKLNNLIEGKEGPNFITKIDKDGYVTLGEFKETYTTDKQKFKPFDVSGMAPVSPRDSSHVTEGTGDAGVQDDIPTPDAFIPEYKVRLGKERKKIHWKDLFKEYEEKKYKAKEFSKIKDADTKSNFIDSREGETGIQEAQEKLIIDKLMLRLKEVYGGEGFEGLSEKDAARMKVAMEENLNQFWHFFKTDPKNPKNRFLPTKLLNAAPNETKIQALMSVLQGYKKINTRMQLQEQLDDPKKNPVMKLYVKAKVLLAEGDYINAYANLNKFKKAKAGKDFTPEQQKELSDNIKIASLGILEVGTSVLNNVLMNPKDRKDHPAYAMIKILKDSIKSGKSANLHDAIKAGAPWPGSNQSLSILKAYNFSSLIKKLATITEEPDDENREAALLREVDLIFKHGKHASRVMSDGDSGAFSRGYNINAAKALLTAVKKVEINKGMRDKLKKKYVREAKRSNNFSGKDKSYDYYYKKFIKEISNDQEYIIRDNQKAYVENNEGYDTTAILEMFKTIKKVTDDQGRYKPADGRLKKVPEGLKHLMFMIPGAGLASFAGRGAATFIAKQLAKQGAKGLAARFTAGAVGVAVEAPIFDFINTSLMAADQGQLSTVFERMKKQGLGHSLKFIGSMQLMGAALNPITRYAGALRAAKGAEMGVVEKLASKYIPMGMHMAGSAGLMTYMTNTSFLNNLMTMPVYHYGGAKFRKLLGKFERRGAVKSQIAQMQLDKSPTARNRANALNKIIGDKSTSIETVQLMIGLKVNQVKDIHTLLKDPIFMGRVLLMKNSIKEHKGVRAEDKPLYDALINRLNKTNIGADLAKQIFKKMKITEIASSSELYGFNKNTLKQASKVDVDKSIYIASDILGMNNINHHLKQLTKLEQLVKQGKTVEIRINEKFLKNLERYNNNPDFPNLSKQCAPLLKKLYKLRNNVKQVNFKLVKVKKTPHFGKPTYSPEQIKSIEALSGKKLKNFIERSFESELNKLPRSTQEKIMYKLGFIAGSRVVGPFGRIRTIKEIGRGLTDGEHIVFVTKKPGHEGMTIGRMLKKNANGPRKPYSAEKIKSIKEFTINELGNFLRQENIANLKQLPPSTINMILKRLGFVEGADIPSQFYGSMKILEIKQGTVKYQRGYYRNTATENIFKMMQDYAYGIKSGYVKKRFGMRLTSKPKPGSSKIPKTKAEPSSETKPLSAKEIKGLSKRKLEDFIRNTSSRDLLKLPNSTLNLMLKKLGLTKGTIINGGEIFGRVKVTKIGKNDNKLKFKHLPSGKEGTITKDMLLKHLLRKWVIE